MTENVEKLRRAIGIDFDHTHGPEPTNNINQSPIPPDQSIPSLNIPKPQENSTPEVKQTSILEIVEY